MTLSLIYELNTRHQTQCIRKINKRFLMWCMFLGLLHHI